MVGYCESDTFEIVTCAQIYIIIVYMCADKMSFLIRFYKLLCALCASRDGRSSLVGYNYTFRNETVLFF